MANSKDSGSYYVEATIDTAGFFTDPVGMYKRNRDKIFFTIRASSDFSGTVHLQFKNADRDTYWHDYDSYTADDRRVIEMSPSVIWRAGVKSGNLSTGDVTVGFDW
jgi:hypothetical protein